MTTNCTIYCHSLAEVTEFLHGIKDAIAIRVEPVEIKGYEHCKWCITFSKQRNTQGGN